MYLTVLLYGIHVHIENKTSEIEKCAFCGRHEAPHKDWWRVGHFTFTILIAISAESCFIITFQAHMGRGAGGW